MFYTLRQPFHYICKYLWLNHASAAKTTCTCQDTDHNFTAFGVVSQNRLHYTVLSVLSHLLSRFSGLVKQVDLQKRWFRMKRYTFAAWLWSDKEGGLSSGWHYNAAYRVLHNVELTVQSTVDLSSCFLELYPISACRGWRRSLGSAQLFDIAFL